MEQKAERDNSGSSREQIFAANCAAAAAAATTAVEMLCIRSAHFAQRQAQRKVSDQAIVLALRFGDTFFQGADRVYFLGRKAIPDYVPAPLASRLDGTTVVVGPDKTLVTTYRNPKGRRALKRRSNGVRS